MVEHEELREQAGLRTRFAEEAARWRDAGEVVGR
jgi:hypothetical protein